MEDDLKKTDAGKGFNFLDKIRKNLIMIIDFYEAYDSFKSGYRCQGMKEINRSLGTLLDWIPNFSPDN